MALYSYRCSHGDFDESYPMGTAPAVLPCTRGCEATRVITIPGFIEDRSRFWRAADGSRYSQALGEQMPESRREIAALAKAKGVEFMAGDEIPSHIIRAKEYGQHIKSGGESLPPDQVAAMVSPPSAPVKSVLERLRESNFRMPELSGPMSAAPLAAFPKDIT